MIVILNNDMPNRCFSDDDILVTLKIAYTALKNGKKQ